MLKSLKLSNFRQHLDRVFHFGPGINAIRGENEHGKTTVLEAFNYLIYGSSALREPLDAVVTYDHPVSKLRVEGEIEHLGVTYEAYRAKSGAEVSAGGKVLVTGQREVTKFFENLFGVDAKVAGKLMFASQKSLAESLKGGPAEAGALIENLAGFDLFDRVISTIQEKRPCGVTSSAEARVETLRAQLAGESAEEDLQPLKQEIQGAEYTACQTQEALEGLQAEVSQLDVAQARQTIVNDQSLRDAIVRTEREIGNLTDLLRQPLPDNPTDKQLEQARAAVESEKQYKKAAGLHAELTRANITPKWDNQDKTPIEGEISALQETISEVKVRKDAASKKFNELVKQLSDKRSDSRVEITRLEGRLIKEATCALCQKDLKDVPEVAKSNSAINAQIEEARSVLSKFESQMTAQISEQEKIGDQCDADLADHNKYLAALQAVVKAGGAAEQLYARAEDYITVDRTTVPATWTWKGPQIGGDRPDVAGQLQTLEAQRNAFVAAQAQHQDRKQRVEALYVERDTTKNQLAALKLDDARETLQKAEEMAPKIEAARAARDQAREQLRTLQAQLDTKAALQEQHRKAMAQVKAQLEASEKELASMRRYNALIKRVREARPVVATKLWNIVLAGVSRYLEDVREEKSTITRADGIFLCNGRPVSGFSGSAEDMLGLAARIALTKTFLPGVDSLHLDEPGAACSDARETRMLGMLATLGFGQIVLISHNDLVDSFADRIINV